LIAAIDLEGFSPLQPRNQERLNIGALALLR